MFVELPPVMEVLVTSVWYTEQPVALCSLETSLAANSSLPDRSFDPGPKRGCLEPNGTEPVDNLKPI